MIDTEALDMRPFLKQLVYAVTKRMDDSKTVIRQSIMKVKYCIAFIFLNLYT